MSLENSRFDRKDRSHTAQDQPPAVWFVAVAYRVFTIPFGFSWHLSLGKDKATRRQGYHYTAEKRSLTLLRSPAGISSTEILKKTIAETAVGPWPFQLSQTEIGWCTSPIHLWSMFTDCRWKVKQFVLFLPNGSRAAACETDGMQWGNCLNQSIFPGQTLQLLLRTAKSHTVCVLAKSPVSGLLSALYKVAVTTFPCILSFLYKKWYFPSSQEAKPYFLIQ